MKEKLPDQFILMLAAALDEPNGKYVNVAQRSIGRLPAGIEPSLQDGARIGGAVSSMGRV